MNTTRHVALVLLGGGVTLVLLATNACSIAAKASDVICVKDQTDICTNCERPKGDTRPYRGRHKCASDGKSFGACMQCAPVDTTESNLEGEDDGEGSKTHEPSGEGDNDPDPGSQSSGPPPKQPPSGGSSGVDVGPACADLASCCGRMQKEADANECRGFVTANSPTQCTYQRDRYASFGKC